MKTGAIALKDDDKSDDEEDEMSQKVYFWLLPMRQKAHAKLSLPTKLKLFKGKFKTVSNWFEGSKRIPQVCLGRWSERNAKYSDTYSENKVWIFL